MYEQGKDGLIDHLMGVQEAASYLGMHRATLFRALGNGLISADYTTPKGRARFRRETVEDFREKLKAQAATSQDHLFMPVRVMARLASLCTGSSQPDGDPVAIINEAVHLLGAPEGAYDMVFVAVHVASETDPYALKVLAQFGVPERLKASYQCLRPYEDFPVTNVLRAGSPDTCNDIREHPFPNATASRVIAQSGIESYAVFPIATGAGVARKTYGVLSVCNRAPHKFSRQEQVFLGGVADALSVCLTHGSLRASMLQSNCEVSLTPEKALNIASLLLETAFSQARSPDALRLSGLPIESLCDLFVERSNALATWVVGFPPQAYGNASGTVREDAVLRQYRSNLESLVLRTRTADGLKREQWQSKVTAVALPVPLPSGQRGAVGAVWPGVRAEVSAEEILLSTLASACSLVTQ